MATPPSNSQPALPAWTWSELEAIALALAVSPAQKLMVRHQISALEREAKTLAPETVIRELAFTLVLACQHSLSPFPVDEETAMT